jgi:hypothetical protein
MNPKTDEVVNKPDEVVNTVVNPKTPEELEKLSKQFKGRIPKALKDEVVAYNKAKKASTVKENRRGEIIQRQKLDMFLEEFLKNGGNATEAALTIAPDKLKNRMSAAAQGSYYLKQAKVLGRVYLEQKGYGYGKLLESAAKKAVDPDQKTPEWWDRVMKVAGYEDFISKGTAGGTTVNVMSVHKGLLDKYVEGEFETAVELPEEELDVEDEDGGNQV